MKDKHILWLMAAILVTVFLLMWSGAGACQQHEHEKIIKIIQGFTIRIQPAIKQGYLDGKPMLVIEDNQDATVYQQGLFKVIHYHKKDKLILLKDAG